MAEYRAIRTRHSMLEVINTPELAAQVTMLPIRAFGFDAGIIFCDILPPLIGMGLDLEFVKGEGPRILNPIRRSYDIDVLGTPPAESTMSSTLKAIQMVTAELAPREIPLVGFAGAPFTLAAYAVEGGKSKAFSRVKALMMSEPAAWKRFMKKLVTVQVDFLIAQVKAGASVLQVFDSWVGLALGVQDYIDYVQPYNRDLFEKLKITGVPVIHFSMGTSSYIEEVAKCGGDVISIDWRLPLDQAWERIGFDRATQGNLDPTALLAPWRELRYRVDDVLARAGSRPGHIFNLGHGILPNTPVENVRRLVEYVRQHTSAGSAGEASKSR